MLAAGQTVVFWVKPIPADAAPVSGNIKWESSDEVNAPVSDNPNDFTGLSALVNFPAHTPADLEFTLTVSYLNSDGVSVSKSNTFRTVERAVIDVEDFSDILTDGVPAVDGSGTGRYGDHRNWTEHGDGTDYPSEGASYGVPQNEALKPFVPFEDDLAVGESVRVIEANGEVSPDARPITSISGEGEGRRIFVEGGDEYGYQRDHVAKVISQQ